jgi:hypothetical protein
MVGRADAKSVNEFQTFQVLVALQGYLLLLSLIAKHNPSQIRSNYVIQNLFHLPQMQSVTHFSAILSVRLWAIKIPGH